MFAQSGHTFRKSYRRVFRARNCHQHWNPSLRRLRHRSAGAVCHLRVCCTTWRHRLSVAHICMCASIHSYGIYITRSAYSPRRGIRACGRVRECARARARTRNAHTCTCSLVTQTHTCVASARKMMITYRRAGRLASRSQRYLVGYVA